jgi:hypothetical protein
MTTVPANSIAAIPAAQTTPHSQPATQIDPPPQAHKTRRNRKNIFFISSLFCGFIQHAYYQ